MRPGTEKRLPLRSALPVIAAAVAAVAAVALPARAAGDEPIDVAVTSLTLSSTVEPDRKPLLTSLGRGLRAGGAEVLDAKEIGRKLAGRSDASGPCSAETCFQDLGRLTGAKYVLQGSVERTRSAYTVAFSLHETLEGTELATERIECRVTAPCPPLPEAVADAGRELARKARAALTLPSPAPVALTLPAPSPAPAPGVRASPSLPDSGAGTRRTVGWAAVAAGSVALVGAATLWALDGRGTCGAGSADACPKVYDTRARAAVLGGLGVAAGIVGVYLLLPTPGGSRTVAVRVARGGVDVAGTF